MGQSATLYRVSDHRFRQIEKSDKEHQVDFHSEPDAMFQGSFMGLEYILLKGQDASTTELISQTIHDLVAIGRSGVLLWPDRRYKNIH